jgi:hypothetical protein
MSGGNEACLSRKYWRVLYLTYNLASQGNHRAQYFRDKHASFPPDIDRDGEQVYVFRV